MAITSEEYQKGVKDSDLQGLANLKDVEKESATAPTKICLVCGFVNGCTANHCENTGCLQFTGWKPGKGWKKGDPDATLIRG